jgi:4-amino-4-deoxy-L-arabinose transferase-like glycosyltransferase
MTTSLTPGTTTEPPASGAPGTGVERTTPAPSRRRPPAAGGGAPGWRRIAFGTDQPRWARPSAFGLIVASAFLYLWNLTDSGWANEFYAAAIQAGSKDWTAWFFGSLDAGNAITVDKPPAAFWLPGLLGRIFGFNSFTMLLPEALMGVAAVALMYAAVKRVSGPAAGLIAGGALAATPVAALMFRFNNPDAMLTFCLVLAAYMTVRAIEKAGWKWLVGAGAILGLAFLTKMLAGLIIVPALGLAYLWAAPTTLRRRTVHLLGALGGLVAVAGAYILAFTLTPTTVRPYMAGSQTNSFLELTFGYNGLARIFGNRGGFGGAVRDRASDAGAAAGSGATGGAGLGGFAGGAPGGGGPGGGAFGGAAGITRMFGTTFGTEISWLLPAALILLVAGFWFTRRAVRTDRVRASMIIWGGWTILTALVFSFMTGTVHNYYAIALAPGIAGVVGIGAAELWRGRNYWPSRIVLAVAVLGTSVWTAVLLGRDASWLPWLRVVVVVLGVLAALGFLVRVDRFGAGRVRAGAVALAVTALLAGGLGPAAFTVATASVGHSGAIPTSGPSSASGFGTRAGFAQFRDRLGASRDGSAGEALGGGATGPAGTPGQAGGFGGQVQGGPGGGATATSELVALLKQTTSTWSAATTGANSAASLELASGTNVIAMGGFMGSDPYPSLDEFKALVSKGEVTYYIAGGGFGGRGGGSTDASAITQWVEANFQAQTVGSTTVYKLVK